MLKQSYLNLRQWQKMKPQSHVSFSISIIKLPVALFVYLMLARRLSLIFFFYSSHSFVDTLRVCLSLLLPCAAPKRLVVVYYAQAACDQPSPISLY